MNFENALKFICVSLLGCFVGIMLCVLGRIIATFIFNLVSMLMNGCIGG